MPNGSNPSLLGLATGFYNVPTPPIPTANGRIVDNQIWKTIHTGQDAYANNFATSANNAGSARFYHGQMAFNFNTINWNTNFNTNIPSNQIDLYSVVLHEVTHALGFASLINPDGTSNFTSGNYYNRYDTFLRNSNNLSLLNNTGACSSI